MFFSFVDATGRTTVRASRLRTPSPHCVACARLHTHLILEALGMQFAAYRTSQSPKHRDVVVTYHRREAVNSMLMHDVVCDDFTCMLADFRNLEFVRRLEDLERLALRCEYEDPFAGVAEIVFMVLDEVNAILDEPNAMNPARSNVSLPSRPSLKR